MKSYSKLIDYVDGWLSDTLKPWNPNGELKQLAANYLLVFSIFDFQRTSGRISSREIEKFCDKLGDDFPDTLCEEQFDFFKNRYTNGGRLLSDRLNSLLNNDENSGKILSEILRQIDVHKRDRILASLIIAYRLRCNLSHGLKWEAGLDDQGQNLAHATAIIIAVFKHSKHLETGPKKTKKS